ncbi:Mu transposase domain-containing protein [Actinomadura coerulea]|uniref:Mu transposase domain-containing protein n=1 Tax=Actinomadura coerulea TaxID=46159 RepID=UPI003416F3A6
MVALPPIAPAVGWRTSTRLARDHYVRIASNYYSVHLSAIGRHLSAIGRLVEVFADPEHVTVTCGGQLVARHHRCWAVHQTITDPAHAQAATVLRRTKIQTVTAPSETEVEQRRLSDYDALLGIEEVVA